MCPAELHPLGQTLPRCANSVPCRCGEPPSLPECRDNVAAVRRSATRVWGNALCSGKQNIDWGNEYESRIQIHLSMSSTSKTHIKTANLRRKPKDKKSNGAFSVGCSHRAYGACCLQMGKKKNRTQKNREHMQYSV